VVQAVKARTAGLFEAGRRRLAAALVLRVLSIGALLLAGDQAPALANETLRLSGFGTLGYAADNRPDVAPMRDIGQLPRNGYATGASWKLDSRVGVQFEYKPDQVIELVGQIVARDHFKADLNSSTELAYLALHPDTRFDVRIGRVGYDAFLMSDHRNVGYAYPWVRPPLEFYGWIPIFSLDGADATYTLNDADARWRIKAQAGTSRFWIPVNSGKGGGYQFKTNNLTGLSATHQSGPLRLKAAHSRFTIASEIPIFAPMHAGLEQVAAAGTSAIGAEAADLRKELTFQDARISYTTFGAAYDDNTWLAQAELGYSTSTVAVVPHGIMAYVGVARRLGDWMPFFMVSLFHPSSAPRAAANDWGAALNAALRDGAVQTANAMRIDQNTIGIGARWDFHRQAAFKLQLDSTRSHPPGDGVWMRDAALNQRSVRLNLLTATLDFVF